MKTAFVFITVLATVAMLVVACTVPGAPFGPATQPASPQQSTGTIEVRVTDAPPGYEITSIMVTVFEDGVKACRAVDVGEEWETIDIIAVDNTFDLTLLADGLQTVLAMAPVPIGKYTQIRMNIETVEVTYTYLGVVNTVEAKLPSGKLKFVRPFDVVDGGTTIILLDFIADKSVTITGKGDVIFKPVVKLVVSGKEKPIELKSSLEITGDAAAELSTEKAHRGKDSVHLETTGTEGTGDEARIVIPLPAGTTLGDIESISWWEYLVQGYPPHLDIVIDIDGVENRLVFEYAYNYEDHCDEAPMPYGAVPEDWFQTFSDDDLGPTQVDDEANGWLASGPPGPLEDPSFIYHTLAEWKSGIDIDGDTIDEETPVLALEIEIDNWVIQSEAYVDDIEIVIGGVTYTVGL